jgi:phytoene dehydrogenase-like protein
MSRPRVIIVGAGVAGLTAGFRPQQQGCDVTVLEAEDWIGGKTASTRINGFVVNTVPSAQLKSLRTKVLDRVHLGTILSAASCKPIARVSTGQ